MELADARDRAAKSSSQCRDKRHILIDPGPGAKIHHPRAQPRHRARVPPRSWSKATRGQQGRAAQTPARQDHRLCGHKRHAETLAQHASTRQFAHLKPSPEVRYADYVVSGMGQDDTTDGMTQNPRFKKETFPQILVSVNMLDTGLRLPGSGEPGVCALHQAPASSTSRCAAGARASRKKQARLHHVRLRGRHCDTTATTTKLRRGRHP
jgi:hypothetical protein